VIVLLVEFDDDLISCDILECCMKF